ncbi:MAG TPA: ATP/GTP-binding protein [Actinomycetota bacterium]
MPRKNRRDPEYLAPSPAGAAPDRFDAPAWAQVDGFEVREVGGQKPYRCPGCDHEVRPGARHLVVVPTSDAEARRHWHTECWRSELRRTGRYRSLRID